MSPSLRKKGEKEKEQTHICISFTQSQIILEGDR